jgi:uncharacterized membrane protein HdeD (DUF308 family)
MSTITKKLTGLLLLISGIALMIGAVVVEAAWLGVCFGTIIVGIAMLFFAPLLLMAPFTLVFASGTAAWASGMSLLSDD